MLNNFLRKISFSIVKNKIINEKINKINLGCGLTVSQNWLNVDGSLNAFFSVLPKIILLFIYRFSGARRYFDFNNYYEILKNHIFLYHNLNVKLPFKPKSFKYAYCSHFLEHITKDQGEIFLKNIFNILEDNGVLRIVVPDLEFAISLYNSDKEKMLKKYFFLNKKSFFSNHRYMYDYETLSKVLSKVGFNKIKRSEYKKSDFPDSDFLDSYPNDSLFIDAYK